MSTLQENAAPTLDPAQAYQAIVDMLDGAGESDDPVDGALQLLALIKFGAELRVRAEHALGQLLTAHPDKGGRPSPGKAPTTGRLIREQLGVDRETTRWLTRLGKASTEDLEAVVDAFAADYPPACSAGSIVKMLSR